MRQLQLAPRRETLALEITLCRIYIHVTEQVARAALTLRCSMLTAAHARLLSWDYNS